jgi:hypothetical protein
MIFLTGYVGSIIDLNSKNNSPSQSVFSEDAGTSSV